MRAHRRGRSLLVLSVERVWFGSWGGVRRSGEDDPALAADHAPVSAVAAAVEAPAAGCVPAVPVHARTAVASVQGAPTRIVSSALLSDCEFPLSSVESTAPSEVVLLSEIVPGYLSSGGSSLVPWGVAFRPCC